MIPLRYDLLPTTGRAIQVLRSMSCLVQRGRQLRHRSMQVGGFHGHREDARWRSPKSCTQHSVYSAAQLVTMLLQASNDTSNPYQQPHFNAFCEDCSACLETRKSNCYSSSQMSQIGRTRMGDQHSSVAEKCPMWSIFMDRP